MAVRSCLAEYHAGAGAGLDREENQVKEYLGLLVEIAESSGGGVIEPTSHVD